MKIDGEAAHSYHAVRLDTFRDAHTGPLIMADEMTGEVRWRDTPESEKTVVLGPGTIRILPKR